LKEILAIIPARAGSKGLIDKNIRDLLGHPLIAYSIKAALTAPSITRILVSTDSEEIAEIANTYGAETPFLRPSEISGDLSTDLEVFQHALKYLLEQENYIPDLVVQLRPTSPIRTQDLIETCIEKLSGSDCDSLRVVTKAFHTPYKMWKVTQENEAMRPLLTFDELNEPYNQPRQLLPEVFWQIGTLDVIRSNVILEENSMSGKKILPYIIAQDLAADIDDLNSFDTAAKILEKNTNCIKFDA
jgi:CMP-N,N'-diacetyllegionaminic acid synthase